MLWFIIAFTIAFAVRALSGDAEIVFGVFLVSVGFAFVVNLFVAMGWSGTDVTINAPVQGQVQTKIINGEPSFVFKAGNRDYVIAVEDVDLKAGEPRYVEKNPSDAEVAWTVFPTTDNRSNGTQHILYINP